MKDKFRSNGKFAKFMTDRLTACQRFLFYDILYDKIYCNTGIYNAHFGTFCL